MSIKLPSTAGVKHEQKELMLEKTWITRARVPVLLETNIL
jgi:hypothetical protein